MNDLKTLHNRTIETKNGTILLKYEPNEVTMFGEQSNECISVYLNRSYNGNANTLDKLNDIIEYLSE